MWRYGQWEAEGQGIPLLSKAWEGALPGTGSLLPCRWIELNWISIST